jgi:hypothetical protein
MHSSTDYYDERGTLIKEVSYDDKGNPLWIQVYGYIDGERVSRMGLISYESDPPLMIGTSSGRKPDPRFQSRYRYEYDSQGNCVKKEYYSNDGTLRMRYVYKFKGNRTEERAYSSDGSVNQRYFTRDNNGNDIESTGYNVKDGSIESRSSHTYQLDAKGNWIKRTTSEWISKDGKSGYVPSSVTYRTISYYE